VVEEEERRQLSAEYEKRRRGEERLWGHALTCGAAATSSKTTIKTSEGLKIDDLDSSRT
jgi:hypothetical protein